jgi:intein-encoded DNA endonuclease-like protein
MIDSDRAGAESCVGTLVLLYDDTFSVMRHGLKRPQRDLAQRMQLFDAVKKYRAEGKSYNAIIAAVEEEFHVRLSKSHVSNWTTGKNLPDGSVTKFVPVPTTSLCYVIGVMQGDGSMSICGDHNYRLKLRVTDNDFAQAFAGAIGIVLNKTGPPVRFHTKTNAWHVDVSSLLLQQFLRRPLEELRPTIEHCDECSGAFLRGFFDSEGSMSGRSLTASNGDLELLAMVTNRLRALSIEFAGPYLIKEGGDLVMIRGKLWRRNLNQYYVHIRARSLKLFQEKVGFCIKRKSDSLALAVNRSN